MFYELDFGLTGGTKGLGQWHVGGRRGVWGEAISLCSARQTYAEGHRGADIQMAPPHATDPSFLEV